MHLHLSISGWLKGCEEHSRCLLLTPEVRRGEMSAAPLPGVWCSPPGVEEGHCFPIAQRKRSTVGLLTNRVTDCSCARLCPCFLCQNSATAELQRLPRTILFCCQSVMSGRWTLSWTSCTDRTGVKSSPMLWLHPSPWDLTKKLPSCDYEVRGHGGRGAVAPQYSRRLESCHRPCFCAVPLAREELTHRLGVAVGGGATSTDLGSADDVAPLV